MLSRTSTHIPRRQSTTCRSFRAAAVRKWGRPVDARLTCVENLVYLCVYPRREQDPQHDYAEIDAFLEHHAWSADEALDRAPRPRRDEPLLIYLGASEVCATEDEPASSSGEDDAAPPTTSVMPPPERAAG